MAESIAPPPKSGGSGPIIIAAVLMLLLIGGLIVWKVTSGGGEQAKTDTQPVATTSVAPVLDEPPPPPPPPPAEPEALKPEEKKTAKGSGGPNPCAKECTGTATGALTGALSGRAGQSRSCYEKALSSNPTLEGTLTVGVKVGPGGQVCSARVVSDGLRDPGVSNCVVNRFAGSTFPAPQGGCAEVNVPLRFMPKR
ncbi:MAG TPA: AgmX/PglI C-terminal domain-containing protein [Polyangiaceae bacterium]|nr:AgmX/PglI C-terminal domain-containing protein [Polyangiaceae bacterium]